jgi:pyruvate dehydrogenase E1 component
MYQLRGSTRSGEVRRVQLLASGALVRVALRAQERLADDFGVTADVWSVTSWSELHRDAIATQRADLLRPEDEPRRAFVARCLGDDPGAVVAVSDYVKALPASVAAWIPGEMIVLGTDGFGRSDDRAALRDFFEVDDRYITLAALVGLARGGRLAWGTVRRAIDELGIDAGKPNPASPEEENAWPPK